jgi:hypothetical protein
VKRSCWCGDQPGSVAVIFAVALIMLMSLAAEVRALALPDYTSLPNWNSALATVQGNIAAGALLHDFNADNSLQKNQTGFWDLSRTRDTTPANLKGRLDQPVMSQDHSAKNMKDLIGRIFNQG